MQQLDLRLFAVTDAGEDECNDHEDEHSLGSGSDASGPRCFPFGLIMEMGGEVRHCLNRVIQFPLIIVARKRLEVGKMRFQLFQDVRTLGLVGCCCPRNWLGDVIDVENEVIGVRGEVGCNCAQCEESIVAEISDTSWW